ncbi:MAG: SDR family NAD(P)-dependent oxidoreductase, partial [Acidimicrobiia bacterium]
VERGAKAAILDLPQSTGAALAEELGDAAAFVPADVTDPNDVERAVAHVVDAFGRLDLCVNAAGVSPPHRVVTKTGELFPLDLFKWVVDVNLVGLFDVVRWAAFYMTKNEPSDEGERGLIVNVASIAGFEGQVGQAAYSASKGGVIAATLTLARDLADWGIRVMAIAPGIMDTPMLAGAPGKLREALSNVHLFPKRLGTPDDFAKLVLHLMENALLNGEVVRLDAAARLAPR